MKMMMLTSNLSTDAASVADSLSAMIQKELTTYCHHDGYLDPSDPTIITPDDRMALVDWCYGVVDHCQFSRESVASARKWSTDSSPSHLNLHMRHYMIVKSSSSLPSWHCTFPSRSMNPPPLGAVSSLI